MRLSIGDKCAVQLGRRGNLFVSSPQDSNVYTAIVNYRRNDYVLFTVISLQFITDAHR